MAVTLTEAQLAGALPEDAPAARLLPVVAAVVQEYAPDAPEALQNEAAIRYAGYLVEAAPGAVSRQRVETLEAELVVNHAPAFRNCGAQALLTRWKVRRGGAV